MLWLGGGPDAGKTSVARLLAQRHGWQLQVLDEQQPRSADEVDRAIQPALWAFMNLSNDQRWTEGPAERMAGWIEAIAAEAMPRLASSLARLDSARPVLVEGPWVFADNIEPLLSSPDQAVWLIPTEAFKRASAVRRDKPRVRHLTSDRELAARLWWDRDLLLTECCRRGAEERGLPTLHVDGSLSVQEVAGWVESRFSRHLAARARSRAGQRIP